MVAAAPALASAALPRTVKLDDEVYEVRAPVTREAIEVIEVLASPDGGELASEYLRDKLLRRWFPSDFHAAFVAAPLYVQAVTLHHLLFHGAEQADGGDGKGDSERDSGPEIGWTDMLGLYCTAYRADPWTVYDQVPFPFFLTMVALADQHLARDALRAAEVAIVPHAKSGTGIIQALRRRAGFGAGAATGQASKERIAADRAALRAMFGGGGGGTA